MEIYVEYQEVSENKKILSKKIFWI